jgi:predicted nucleic acid-binding protein
MITNPKSSPENEACKNWLASLAYNGVEIVIPEIADYEVRRELLRAGKDRGLGRLDALKGMLEYAPITTPVMLKAAEFWATARKMGRQSADDASLDADMILVAQAGAIVHDRAETVIATANVPFLA